MTRQIRNALIAVGMGLSTMAQSPVAPEAVPIEPVGAILDAFRQHNIVALSEPHMNEQGHALRLALLRHSRFSSMVNDIVWECGNARYQNAMDRFIGGEDVAWNPVWQHTIGSIGTVCDHQMYEDFLRAVRDLNSRLPTERHLRVLLGDPPVDWETVHTAEDAVKWAQRRESHGAAVIENEVLSKGRRALVIYGSAHLMRANIRQNYDSGQYDWLVGILARDPRARILSIWSDTTVDLAAFQPSVSAWSAPRFALLRATQLGARDFVDYWTAAGGAPVRFTLRDGRRVEITKEQWRPRRMDEQYDAVIYYGPRSAMTYSRLPPARCADPAYMKMRLGRMALVGQPTQALQDYCASVTK